MESIRVVCRIRTLKSAAEAEKERNSSSPLSARGSISSIPSEEPLPYNTDGKAITIDMENKRKTYEYDSILGPNTSQAKAYAEVGEPLLDHLLNGINCAILAYGQTGSGKTHTMSGGSNPRELGIIPRLLQDLFSRISCCEAHEEYCVQASYLQVYQEQVMDLLAPRNARDRHLPLREDRKNGSWVVNGALSPAISSWQQAQALLEQGARARKVASTGMNAESSRSHAVFMLSITKRDTERNEERTAFLYLVDLAGSESVGRTGATGQTLDEAKAINKSLCTLRSVVIALVAKAKCKKGPGPVVPYRESMLTRLLKNALGGNSRTVICLCASSNLIDAAETDSTMKFGQTASLVRAVVKENVRYNAEQLEEMLKEAEGELAELQSEVRALEAEIRVNHEAMNSGDNRRVGGARAIPACFKCPLTGQMMENPVICNNGHTYEKQALAEYYKRYHVLPSLHSLGVSDMEMSAKVPTNPCSSTALPPVRRPLFVIPNASLARRIKDFQANQLSPIPLPMPCIPFAVWEPPKTMSDVPIDCIQVTLAYLEPHDLVNAFMVCLDWARVASSNAVWITYVMQHFGVKITDRNPAEGAMEWFQRLVLEHKQSKANASGPSCGLRLVRPH